MSPSSDQSPAREIGDRHSTPRAKPGPGHKATVYRITGCGAASTIGSGSGLVMMALEAKKRVRSEQVL